MVGCAQPGHLGYAVSQRIEEIFGWLKTVAAWQKSRFRGIDRTDPAGDCWTPAEIWRMRVAGQPFRAHGFELACADLDIDHRLTKPNHLIPGPNI